MGVMSCSRRCCENVMCDTYVHSVGYVCHDCQTEFALFLESKGKSKLGTYEMVKELNEFVATEKSYSDFGDQDEMSSDEFFRFHNGG